MTFYEFIVPVLAFAVAIAGYLLLSAEDRRLDREEANTDRPAE